jgi:hypothetical protein
VPRVKVDINNVKCILAKNNAEIAEETIRIIIEHAPIFAIGHNVYEFDNVKLACALPPESEYRQVLVCANYSYFGQEYYDSWLHYVYTRNQ